MVDNMKLRSIFGYDAVLSIIDYKQKSLSVLHSKSLQLEARFRLEGRLLQFLAYSSVNTCPCTKALQCVMFRPGLVYNSYYRLIFSILLMQKGNLIVLESACCLVSCVPADLKARWGEGLSSFGLFVV